MKTGAELLLKDSSFIKKGKRLAYMGHSASVDSSGRLILSSLLENKDWNLKCLFSPQHGFFPVAQANMISTEDSTYKGLPLFSLYSKKNLRLTQEMADHFDILLFDLQDVGVRVYTYISSLFWLLEDCEKFEKTIYVLDRPNPLGRYVEGSLLNEKFKSFVGVAPLPMSHGWTLAEAAHWYKNLKGLKTDLHVVKMKGYDPLKPWNKPWVLPSPNMTGLNCARIYPGGVLFEGTIISEGRGTTKPFEIFGFPGLETEKIKKWMKQKAPSFLKGCFLKETEFQATFGKFKGEVCSGFQIYLDKAFAEEGSFRPYRLISLFLKAFREFYPDKEWKIPPPYEFEFHLKPIDIISGSEALSSFVEDTKSPISNWEEFLLEEETKWKKEQKDFFLY